MSPTADAILVDHRGRKYLTAEERTRFLAAVRSRPKPTVQTLTRTLALTGCRVSEALGIRACEVDLEANEIRIATLKRRRSHWRAVPIPEEAGLQALELVHRLRAAQARQRGRNRPVWPIHPPDRDPPSARAHAPRRHHRTPGPPARPSPQLRRRGVPLPTIAAVLGHANLSTTAIYTTAIGAEAGELVARVWNT